MSYPTCPACGEKDAGSMVRCGKYRAYICLMHCYEGCEYFSDFGGTSIVHCFFRERMLEKREAGERATENKA